MLVWGKLILNNLSRYFVFCINKHFNQSINGGICWGASLHPSSDVNLRVSPASLYAGPIFILSTSWQDLSTCLRHELCIAKFELSASSTQGCLIQKQLNKQGQLLGSVPPAHIARVPVKTADNRCQISLVQ